MDLILRPGRPILIPRVRFVGPRAAREVDLFLDTGALSTLLAIEVLLEIGLDPLAAQRRVPIVTANGVITVPVVKVPAVELAGARLSNVQVLGHSIPELADAEGLLGLNLLEHFVTTLDYRTRQLQIQPVAGERGAARHRR